MGNRNGYIHSSSSPTTSPPTPSTRYANATNSRLPSQWKW
jgi:hypothetical protein